MGYYIDLALISIDEYEIKLKSAYLVPSRMILKENIEDNFNKIKNQGISNLLELQKALKNKDKLNSFSKLSGLPIDYLTILLREINSINPKPNLLKDFNAIEEKIIKSLENDGIKNTFQLYGLVKTREAREGLSKKLNIDEGEILKIAKLTDISRIKWASPLFCIMLYHLGFDSVYKVAGANYKNLHEKVNQENKKQKYYKGNIGLNDIKIFIEAAKDVQTEIEY